jgi:raffinose synthase
MKKMLCLMMPLLMAWACSPSPNGLTVDGASDVYYNGSIRLKGLKPASDAAGALSKADVSLVVDSNILVVSLSPNGSEPEDAQSFVGSFFDEMPEFKQGVTIWRYKPWNSWTKPILVTKPSEIESWDVQFFYWQYADGTYGAAMPLSGKGYRTTLGNNNGLFGAKSVRYAKANPGNNIPQMAIGFGNDPYKLFRDIYRTGLTAIGKSDNLIDNKTFPKQLDYIGWCTWNSSDLGKHLDEEHVVAGVKTFTDNKFPLGWVIIDDGWFDNKGAQLNSLLPDPKKFPKGFKSMNDRLKSECGIREMGLWHAFNGYWNGINPESKLGQYYKDEMFSWSQKPNPTDHDSVKRVTYHFIKPESDSLATFYSNWHQMMREQGFTFLKVDNQLVVERMAVDNYPIFDLSEKMHQALYTSIFDQFDGAVINCMNMTADAYLNFDKSSVARAVEDYFPAYEGGVGYKLEKGNAAAHLLMGFYNSLYFQQMVYPDFDMFESHNPDAVFHAVARAINNGPVYVTDKPGQQNFDVLRPLCFSNGKLIRATHPLTPSRDCLFNMQQPVPFKAFSFAGKAGLLGVWNMADADTVSGFVSAADIEGLEGDKFVAFEHFSRQFQSVDKSTQLPIGLARMGCQLYYFLPVVKNVAVIGLLEKYNAPGTVSSIEVLDNSVSLKVADYGTLALVTPAKPNSVKVNGGDVDYTFENGLCCVQIPHVNDVASGLSVSISW